MNKFESERRFAERMKRCYPPGTRLLLLSMDDPYAPVECGTRGTVVPGEDSFRKLTDEELAEEHHENMDEENAPVLGM